jgi:predicted transcriptional regulator
MSEEDFATQSVILRAIWHIDKKQGQEIIKNVQGKNEFLDGTIKLLKEGLI